VLRVPFVFPSWLEAGATELTRRCVAISPSKFRFAQTPIAQLLPGVGAPQGPLFAIMRGATMWGSQVPRSWRADAQTGFGSPVLAWARTPSSRRHWLLLHSIYATITAPIDICDTCILAF